MPVQSQAKLNFRKQKLGCKKPDWNAVRLGSKEFNCPLLENKVVPKFSAALKKMPHTLTQYCFSCKLVLGPFPCSVQTRLVWSDGLPSNKPRPVTVATCGLHHADLYPGWPHWLRGERWTSSRLIDCDKRRANVPVPSTEASQGLPGSKHKGRATGAKGDAAAESFSHASLSTLAILSPTGCHRTVMVPPLCVKPAERAASNTTQRVLVSAS